MSNRIAAIVLALSCLAWSACGGSHPSPTSPSTPTGSPTGSGPVVRLDVKADDLGSSEAVVGLSNVLADASASTGTGTLTFAIDFGDGSTSTAATARHTYNTAGTFTITATVTDGQGRKVTDAKPITVTSVAGRWFEAEYVPRSRQVEVRRLTVTSQDGLTIRGSYQVNNLDRSFTGTLEPPRSARIALDGGATLDGVLPGRLNVEGENWFLQAHGDTVDGERLEFRAITADPGSAPPDADYKLSFDNGVDAWAPFAALTPVHIDASLSRGEGLTYFLEFGDGFVATTSLGSHVVDAPDVPALTARVTVVDRFGRSNAEAVNYFVFELGIGRPRFTGDYWISSGSATTLFVEFLQRTGVNYVGEASLSGGTNRVTALGTLGANGDIRIVLPESGIEFRGTVKEGVGYNATMTLVQSGGASDGKTWNLYLQSRY